MNKLEKIASGVNNAITEVNSLRKSITDEKGLYEAVKILLDVYITNNPAPYSGYKENIIDSFFTQMNTAYDRLKDDYKWKEEKTTN